MQVNKTIVIGSRGSDLALWQAHFVRQQLTELGHAVEIKIIVTKGDRIQDLSFNKIEGKGFFTKEIEEALLAGEIDLAVHSLKDLPTSSPEGLQIAALSYREDPRDLLIIRRDAHDAAQPLWVKNGGRIGTSSARRKVQIKLLQADLDILDLRGNVPTRIQKCRDGHYDAIVLAAAGVARLQLNMDEFVTYPLDPARFVPAPAQGVLGLQIRENDAELAKVMAHLHDHAVADVVGVERETLRLFEGGCQMPVGVYCTKNGDMYEATVVKALHDEGIPLKVRLQGTDPSALPRRLIESCNKQRQGLIFVSREGQQWPVLIDQLRAHGYAVHAQSLISTQSVPFEAEWLTPDWLFFVSGNAVRHFLASAVVPTGTRLAAVGEGSAEALQKAGFEVEFIGQGNDIEHIARQFAALAQGKSVLCPVGSRSRRTVQQVIEKQVQLQEVLVYETHLHTTPLEIEPLACIISSPSNAEALLQSCRLAKSTLLIAMGNTTADWLKQQGFERVVVPRSFSQDQLACEIFSNL